MQEFIEDGSNRTFMELKFRINRLQIIFSVF